jgi:hypothetical protein
MGLVLLIYVYVTIRIPRRINQLKKCAPDGWNGSNFPCGDRGKRRKEHFALLGIRLNR